MIERLMHYFLKQDDEYETLDLADDSKETTPLCDEEGASWLGIG